MIWGHRDAEQWTEVGAPVPGTEEMVVAIETGARGAAGAGGMGAADPYFDPAAFTVWSVTVFDRALTAWKTGNPETLRPVMEERVWNRYAQWLLFARGVPVMRTIMGGARAEARFLGVGDGGSYHSAVVEFAAQAGVTALTPGGAGSAWRERWLFQRPDSYRTVTTGAVAVCPVCGAPADPEETGQCRYCHADITTRTAGWLVTRTATTLQEARRLADTLFGGGPGVSAAAAGAGRAGGAPLQPPRGAPVQPPRGAPLQPPRGAPLQPPRAGPPWST